MSEEKEVNRKSKDSLFVNFFSYKENVLQLYKDFHPEDEDVTEDDIEIRTLTTVLANNIYNDLGFIVKNTLLLLIEAQSTWNPNIIIRLLFYLCETWKRYIEDTKQSVHYSKKVRIPRPELYVVYTGHGKRPEKLSLKKEFFGGISPVDIEIKVLTKEDATICGQYITFCHVFDEQKKLDKETGEIIRDTVRICVEKGCLAEYLKNHEQEAISMMWELFNEEYILESVRIAEQRDREELKAKSLAEGRAEGENIMLEKMRKAGLTEEQIKSVLSVK